MRTERFFKVLKCLTPGAILLQMGGCDLAAANELLQTIFLGITAAGGVAILQNI